MPTGINFLYWLQFSRVILVPSGIAAVESAAASAEYAFGSKLTSALAVQVSARAISEAQITASQDLAIVRARFIVPLLWSRDQPQLPLNAGEIVYFRLDTG